MDFKEDIYGDVLQTFEHFISTQLTKQRRDSAFPHIAFTRSSNFLKSLQIAKDLIPKKKGLPSFLDVGCGIGTVPMIAKGMGFNSFGIEIREEYREILEHNLSCCKYIFDDEKCRHKFCVDHDYRHFAITDDRKFNQYDQFDCVYIFRPMSGWENEQKLEDRICKKTKKGTIIIAPGGIPISLLELVNNNYISIYKVK